MPTVEEARTRLAALKAEGKTEGTSKEAGKLSQIISGQRSASNSSSGTSGFSMPDIDYTQMAGGKEAGKQLQSIVSPLQQRYSALLDQITRREKSAVEQTTLTQARELGRRGISTTSGLGERTIGEAVTPIRGEYAGLAAQTGISQEQAIQSAIQAFQDRQQAAQQQQFENTLAQQKASQSAQLSPLDQLVQTIIDRQSGGVTPAASGLPGMSGNAPAYTPVTGEGSLSSDGKWIFRGGKWVSSSAAPTSGLSAQAGLQSLADMFK